MNNEEKPKIPPKVEGIEDCTNVRHFTTEYDRNVLNVGEADEDEEIDNKELYEILEVSKDSSKDEIKVKFHEQSKNTHPDKHKKNKRKMEYFSKKQAKINRAKETLLDEFERAKYDILGRSGSKAVVLDSGKKEFFNLEDFKSYLHEEKLAYRKRYFDILTESTSTQKLMMEIPWHVYPPLVILMETLHRFTIPLTKQSVVRVTGSTKFLPVQRRSLLMKGVQFCHYFKNKHNHNLNNISFDMEYFVNHWTGSMTWQRMIDMRRNLLVRISNEAMITPLIGYLGFDLYVERRIFSNWRGYWGFHFPFHRRVMYTGMSNENTDLKVVLSPNEQKVGVEQSLLDIESIDAVVKVQMEVSSMKMKTKRGKEETYNHFDISIVLYKQVFDPRTHVGLGLGVDSDGMGLKFYFKRLKHNFSVMLQFPNWKYYAIGGTAILGLLFGGAFLRHKLVKKSKRKQRKQSWEKLQLTLLDERRNQLMELKSIQTQVNRKRLDEISADNGLVITKARYGVLENEDEDEACGDSKLVKFLDVTDAIQFQVRDSELRLSSVSKSVLTGIFDISPEEDKQLEIEYRHQGCAFKVRYEDEDEVKLPLDRKMLFKNERDFT